MNSETCQRIALRRYASLLLAACFSISCYPDFPCEMMGTCPLDNPEAGIVDGTGTESNVSTTRQDTSSERTLGATLDDAGSETSSTSTASGQGNSTSSAPNAECLPVSDEGCDGETPWCLEENEDLDGGTYYMPRCVQCEDDTHCQWPYATQEHSEVCLNYVCTPCELGSNRGCGEDAPYCLGTGALVTGDASVGHSNFADGGAETTSAQCVECLTETDCGGSTPACVNHACVACDRDEQCSNAEASRCDLDTNTCAPCNAVGQCAHLSNTPACDVTAGTCVECTREEQTKCGSKVCNLLTEDDSYQTCSEFPAGETTQCYECVSDTQCAEGYRCVQETFKVPSSDAGVEPTGKRYCMALERELLRLKGRNCTTNRPFVGSFEATSVGDETGTYCRPRFTTCSAYLMHGNGPDVIPEGQPGAGDTTCLSNDSCGLATVTDGYCVKLPNSEPPTNRCTYECGSNDDCKGNVVCNFDSPSSGLLPGNGVCSVTTNPPSGGSEP